MRAVAFQQHDVDWAREGSVRGWYLPEPAPAPLRWPLVRHLRWAVLAYRTAQWDARWASLGLIPTGYDRWVLYAIRRGWV